MSATLSTEDPEFLKDMEEAGREITRCFGRASQAYNFFQTAIDELSELHAHMVKMKQVPESILVKAAVGLLEKEYAAVLQLRAAPYVTDSLVTPRATKKVQPRRKVEPGVTAEPELGVLSAGFFKSSKKQ